MMVFRGLPLSEVLYSDKITMKVDLAPVHVSAQYSINPTHHYI